MFHSYLLQSGSDKEDAEKSDEKTGEKPKKAEGDFHVHESNDEEQQEETNEWVCSA